MLVGKVAPAPPRAACCPAICTRSAGSLCERACGMSFTCRVVVVTGLGEAIGEVVLGYGIGEVVLGYGIGVHIYGGLA